MPDLYIFAYIPGAGGVLSPMLMPPTAGEGLVGTFDGSNFKYSLAVPVSIADGGTNATSMANTYGVNFFDGTSISSTTAGTSGQVLLGSASGAPSFVTPTAGSGLTGTFNDSTLSFAISAPVSVANGGTGSTSFTSNGAVYYDGSKLSTTSAGSAGQVLISSGSGGPSYVTPTAGSGLSGTFNGTTFSYSLQSPVSVSNGGTNATSITNSNSPLYYDGSKVNSITAGTSGQILVGSTGSPASFVTPTAGTGLTGTFNASTLSFALSVPVSIANGGTNATSMANTNGTLIYDGTRLSAIAPGTSGQVLTSNGSGSAPSYQTAAASAGNSFISTANPGFALATIGAKSYIAPWASALSTTAANQNSIVPNSGTISRMYVWITANISTNAVTVTLNVNGVNSALVATVPASTTGVFSDLTHSVSVSAGDKIQWEISAALVGVITGSIVCQFRG